MIRSLMVVVFTFAATPEGALACSPAPPFVQLPGESKEAYKARSDAGSWATEFENDRRMQEDFLSHASRITIGLIENVEPLQLPAAGVEGHKVVVRVKKTLKGDSAPELIRLADRSVTSCGFYGGGTATQGSVGDYVVVFQGLDSSQGATDPYGLRASDVRHAKLLDAFRDYGLETQRHASGQ